MSPRTQQQWAEMRLNASEKIISAALDVFKQKGFHRASMEEIAKQAEVSKGLAYNYFRSKEHLLAAVMERRFNEAEGLIQGIDEISGLSTTRYHPGSPFRRGEERHHAL